MEIGPADAPRKRLRARPSLLQLCLKKAASILPDISGRLHILPLEIAEILFTDYVGKGNSLTLVELEIFSEAFWNPVRLCLTGVDKLNSGGLHYLPHYASNLLKLDLTGCSWLDSVAFLPGLSNLRCLGLRDCWRLPGDSLTCIRQLPKLECLDLENVYSITDGLAALLIQGMTSLKALNVSGTGVADGFMEALTYGCRLQSWKASRGRTCTKRVDDYAVPLHGNQSRWCSSWNDSHEQLMRQWQPVNIKYLRLHRTRVTQAAISHLMALPDVVLLDLRTLNVTKSTVAPLEAKYSLVALPNSYKLMARTNSLLLGALGGSCGCLAMASIQDDPAYLGGEQPDRTAEFEQRGMTQLLQAGSRVSTRHRPHT